MQILVVGAGAIGGYFGGRLLQAKRDVTFLVRERRAAQLRKTGLVIKSPTGDFTSAHPTLIQATELRQPFDLILLSCKAYDLQSAIESFAPAVGPGTIILPLLNGMRHLDVLAEKFGASAVLGGLCLISTSLDAQGHILHLNDSAGLTFGERNGGRSARVDSIQSVFRDAAFDSRASENILQAMWEKWVFIASAAGITCLMRSALGDIGAAGGTSWSVQIYEECARIAAEAGFAPSQPGRDVSLKTLTTPGSKLTASMLRDIEGGGRTEVDQILGDLLARRRSPTTRSNTDPTTDFSILAAAHLHVKAYEARRNRELSG
jgi:2-dehydropantoate 2-reductase